MNTESIRKETAAILARIRRLPGVPEQRDAIQILADSSSLATDQALLRLMADRVPDIRETALEVLAGCGDRTLARIAARAALGDPATMVRCTAVEILADLGTRASDVHRLAVALRTDKEWVIRASAADSLRAIGGKSARRALLQALTIDPHPVVRRDAALALANDLEPAAVLPALKKAAVSDTEEQAGIGLRGALYLLLEQSEQLAGLLSFLKSEDSSVRHATVNTLMQVVQRPEDCTQAIAALEEMLRDEENPGLRADARLACEQLAAAKQEPILC